MTVNRPRVPAGVPTGGRFTHATRAEAPLVFVPEIPEDLGLPAWTAPSDTADPEGAFSRCKEVSAEYTEHLRAHGIDAEWVQVVGPRGDFPAAQEPWRGLRQDFWQHYLTRAPGPDGDYYVDFTARQFDPEADHPQIVRADAADWAETYPIATSSLDAFLDSWRSEHNLAAAPEPVR